MRDMKIWVAVLALAGFAAGCDIAGLDRFNNPLDAHSGAAASGPVNLIKNGDFSLGTTYWAGSSYTDTANSQTGSAVLMGAAGSLSVSGITQVTDPYVSQFRTDGYTFSLKQGKTYKLSFSAKCVSGTRSIKVTVMKGVAPFTVYKELATNLSTSDPNPPFETTFSMGVNEASGSLIVACGQSNVNFLMDDVSLVELP